MDGNVPMDGSPLEELAGSTNWKKDPHPPVPGFYKIDVVPSVDMTSHDSSLDASFRRIHTPFFSFFPLDILQELQEFSKKDEKSWLRTNENIDGQYFREQSERRDLIKRDEVNEFISDVFDYQEYVLESFEAVNEQLNDMEIVEEYPLFPMPECEEKERQTYALVYGAEGCGDVFEEVAEESSLMSICTSGTKRFKCVKQASDNAMIMEIRDGKTFYMDVPYVYKFKEIKD